MAESKSVPSSLTRNEIIEECARAIEPANQPLLMAATQVIRALKSAAVPAATGTNDFPMGDPHPCDMTPEELEAHLDGEKAAEHAFGSFGEALAKAKAARSASSASRNNVVWGPEEQNYPGGPIFRRGSSTGATLPEQPATTPPTSTKQEPVAWLYKFKHGGNDRVILFERATSGMYSYSGHYEEIPLYTRSAKGMPHYGGTLRTIAHHLHDLGEDEDGNKLENIADELESRSG